MVDHRLTQAILQEALNRMKQVCALKFDECREAVTCSGQRHDECTVEIESRQSRPELAITELGGDGVVSAQSLRRRSGAERVLRGERSGTRRRPRARQ